MQRNQIDNRDLKPLNILMFNDGKDVKIADFGLSKQTTDKNNDPTQHIGTPSYWAPEIINGNHKPFKSDMYSLGLILYFIMAKKLPNKDSAGHADISDIPLQYS